MLKTTKKLRRNKTNDLIEKLSKIQEENLSRRNANGT